MSEFRFSCPNCSQHLMGDVRYAGLQITCPSCGKQVAVPAAPAAASVTIAPTVPPVPGAPPPQATAATPKTSGLAIASLVCSSGSFLAIPPLGFIPGIICGHLAKKRIAATPGLGGRGLAKAGLIIGYVALGLHVLAAMALAGFFFFFARSIQQAKVSAETRETTKRTQSFNAAPEAEETADTQADGSGWTLKLGGVETPSAPVTGRIHGQPFKLEKVTLNNGWLKLSQGKEFFADLEMDIVTFEHDNRKLSGRSFTVPKEGFGSNPHIWMKWKESGQRTPKQKSFMDRYALRLEFGQLEGDKLPGKIYLCVPDKEKSFVAGTFEANVKGER